MVLGPLRYYSGVLFGLLVSKTSVTPESVLGVVGGCDVVYVVVDSSQTLRMPNITLSKHWVSISIQVSSSLDHHATTEVHGASSLKHQCSRT